MQKAVRILIVDDDPDVCEYLEKFLQREGYGVKTVTLPDRVIPELRAASYQIVILDLRMPGISGVELLRRVREQDKDICVIIYTGPPSVDSAVETMKQNVYDYIKKPFDLMEFRALIQRAIRERGLVANPEATLNSQIGNTIRSHRKQAGMTLKQLANRTGLSVSLISQIELAKTSASVSTLYKIAQALNIRIADFFADA